MGAVFATFAGFYYWYGLIRKFLKDNESLLKKWKPLKIFQYQETVGVTHFVTTFMELT